MKCYVKDILKLNPKPKVDMTDVWSTLKEKRLANIEKEYLESGNMWKDLSVD